MKATDCKAIVGVITNEGLVTKIFKDMFLQPTTHLMISVTIKLTLSDYSVMVVYSVVYMTSIQLKAIYFLLSAVV